MVAMGESFFDMVTADYCFIFEIRTIIICLLTYSSWQVAEGDMPLTAANGYQLFVSYHCKRVFGVLT